MSDFDYDAALAAFRRTLAIRLSIDPAVHAELESSLQDRYEANLISGLAPAEAFAAAKVRVLPETPGKVDLTDEESAGLQILLPSYLKTGLRNLRRRAGFSLLNFVCLAVGMFTVALAALYIGYETSYDSFVPDVERKYRMGRTYRSQGYSVVALPNYFGSDPAVQMAQLEAIEEVPGVAQAAQFFVFDAPTFVTEGERKLTLENLLQTNTPARFVDFFGFEVLAGSAEMFARQLNTVLLTEREAERLYGTDWASQELTGRVLAIDTTDFTVAGVLADVPANAHFTFSAALHVPRIDYWGVRMYVETVPGAEAATVAAAIDANMGKINSGLAADELFGGTLLQPLPSIHFQSDLLYEMKPPGDKRYLYIIGLIAGIILLLTVLNYTNLSVAMNAGRTREIGMRKVFGASTTQIAVQFVIEAVVLSALALPIVALALYVLLPGFDELMDTQLAARLGDSWQLGLWLLLGGLAVGVLASVYPAALLARQRVLRLFGQGLGGKTLGGYSVRKLLVGVQFALLIGLCSLAVYVNRQLDFLQQTDIGYVRDGILYVSVGGDSMRLATYRDQLEKLPSVTSVGSDGFMGTTSYNQTTYQLDGTPEVYDDAHQVEMSYASAKLLGLEVSTDVLDNQTNRPARQVFINETMAARFAARQQVTAAELPGRTLVLEPEYVDEESGQIGFPITLDGSFADINMFSLRNAVEPMILILRESPRYAYWAVIGYEGASPAEIREQAERVFAEVAPTEPFVHRFLSDNLDELYAAEQRIAKLSTLFSGVALLVALIGLIALTAYLTTVRRKEISIRRILGASTFDVLRQFNAEYIWLLLIAFVVAAPLTYWGVSVWLQGFAYRIDVVWWVPVAATLVAAAVTVVIVSGVVGRAIVSRHR